MSANGTVTPLYARQASVALSYYSNGGMSNTSAVVEAPSDAVHATYPWTSTTYYHGDHLGSTRLATTAAGWPVSAETYYPFGLEQAVPADANHYKFTGYERDAESTLDHATFRQLSFTQGRWTSPDPYDGSYSWANPQSFNRYSYALNNPLVYLDPKGLDDCQGTEGGYDGCCTSDDCAGDGSGDPGSGDPGSGDPGDPGAGDPSDSCGSSDGDPSDGGSSDGNPSDGSSDGSSSGAQVRMKMGSSFSYFGVTLPHGRRSRVHKLCPPGNPQPPSTPATPADPTPDPKNLNAAADDSPLIPSCSAMSEAAPILNGAGIVLQSGGASVAIGSFATGGSGIPVAGLLASGGTLMRGGAALLNFLSNAGLCRQ